ncbi:hypothetical protein [Bradyrhizobium sp. 192]|uniref:hypothetical protein n=1 Tax=Bradyrhizobium sp. 192 TaxID=2782660 RepID=UPI001FFE7577|nr:hypothetical protein [Bradyrhizobium sp. 192]UPJ59945.1 hypothetical protein IVB24_09805 [Bradyrhizobium sp. 192]
MALRDQNNERISSETPSSSAAARLWLQQSFVISNRRATHGLSFAHFNLIEETTRNKLLTPERALPLVAFQSSRSELDAAYTTKPLMRAAYHAELERP